MTCLAFAGLPKVDGLDVEHITMYRVTLIYHQNQEKSERRPS